MWKDSETTLDFLDFEYLKDSLIKIIIDDKLTPSCVGIYGDWGSGKSSLMRMCREELEKKDKYLCISFNGWLFEGYEDTKTALIGSILDRIKEEQTLSSEAKETIKNLYNKVDKLKLISSGLKYGADFLLTGGIGTLANLTLSNLINKGGEGLGGLNIDEIKNLLSDEFSNEEVRQNIKNFQTNFDDLLKQTNCCRLVVFIDELDRCNPDTIVETLEAIRLFLFVQKTSFVIGADERHIEYAIKKQYPEIEGHQINIGKEYLEKIVQYPIRIPPLSEREINFYILCLFFEKELNQTDFLKIIEIIRQGKEKNFFEFELTHKQISEYNSQIANQLKDAFSIANQLSSILSDKLNGNPRHCKRFLNSLIMREMMANSRKIPIQKTVLAKMMLLEYFKHPFFLKLYDLQFNEKRGNEIFNEMENGKYPQKFEIWENDPWVKKWIESDPKISNEDLKPYFYFSRESLAKKYKIGLLELSPEGMEIFLGLSSGSQIKINQGIKDSELLDDNECKNILEKLIENYKDKPDNDDIFKVILDFGKSRPTLILTTIDFLTETPGKNINFGIIPYVKEFGITTQRISEIKQVVNTWKNENKALNIVINREFEGI